MATLRSTFHAMPRRATPYHAMPCHAIPHHTIPVEVGCCKNRIINAIDKCGDIDNFYHNTAL